VLNSGELVIWKVKCKTSKKMQYRCYTVGCSARVVLLVQNRHFNLHVIL
jgi:hypothetical protein